MEDIVMFNRWNRLRELATTAAAALIGLTLVANAWAIDQCRSPTPCPCYAEGVCRPNAYLWGHYKTRWRTWPGETKTVGATPDVADPRPDELNLDPYDLPKPEEEDQRGPARTTMDKTSDPAGVGGAVEEAVQPQQEEAVQPQPAEDVLPDFELQGYQGVILNGADDAPPALPSGLLQAAVQQLGNQVAASKASQPRLTNPIAARVLPVRPVRPIRLPAVTSRPQPVVQANVDMSKRLKLVNPAAGSVVTETKLEKAIFFEATDLPPSFPGQ